MAAEPGEPRAPPVVEKSTMTTNLGPEAFETPVLRPKTQWMVLLAVLVVLVMVGSGFVALTPAGGASTLPVARTPSLGAPWISPMALQTGQQLQSDPVTPLAGAPLSNLPNASVVGAVNPNQDIYFTVGFPLQNAPELATIINEQGQPGSPLYHDWLNNAQEQAMFGPPPTEVQNTVNYFTSLGFQVGTVGAISVSFHAPIHLVERAFHTTIQNVQYGSANAPNTTYANTAPLELPAPIALGVGSIDGLSGPGNYHYEHSQSPDLLRAIQAADAGEAGMASAALAPAVPSTVYNATLAELFNYTDQSFTWFQLDYAFHRQAEVARWQSISSAALNNLFQANPLLAKGYNGNSTGSTGGNPITIAIVMEGGINVGDMQAYSTLVYNNPNQILNRLSVDPIDGAYKMNGTLYYTDGASGEMALDIEYSSTMAPGAHILAVYSQAFFGNMLDDQYASLDSLSGNQMPNIISNSWGGSEDGAGTLYTPGIGSDAVMHDYFMLLDAKGISILASSGDGGGFDDTTGILSGSFPASDPYVLSVDGLRTSAQDRFGQIFPYQNLSYGNLQTFIPLLNQFKGGAGVDVDLQVTKVSGLHNQSYWYEPLSNLTLYNAPPSGSGGFGFSYWQLQPWWQHGIGTPNVGRSLGSGVAAEADFNMSIFFDGVPNWLYGGTSFACPTTAGMLADVLDYLRNPGGGQTAHRPFLGNMNIPVWEVGNAWQNGNLSNSPYYDITNGTSFWGNHGAKLQYSWPPGQNFPMVNGVTDYGNTLTGWDFPTGWGSINVYNFALDMEQLESEESFVTTTSTGALTAGSAALWYNMTLNQTYHLAAVTTPAISSGNPVVRVEYFPGNAKVPITTSFSGAQLTSTALNTTAFGLDFTLNTGSAMFASANYAPGLLIFTLGTNTNRNAGFWYDYINPYVPPGNLTVTVQKPSKNGIVGGCATANLDQPLGLLVPPIVQSGLVCEDYTRWSGGRSNVGTLYENTFAVKVTNAAGNPVYDAVVTATVPQITDLAWVGSQAELLSSNQGRSVQNPTNVVSVTFTNTSGYALVQTWNMAQIANYTITANYGNGSEKGSTQYMVVPAYNVQPLGIDGGKYAEFNEVDLELYIYSPLYHSNYSNYTLNTWVQNWTTTSSLYSTFYAWQGQVLKFKVSDSKGNPVQGDQAYVSNYDVGQEYKFQRYEPTAGVLGVTNSTGTYGFTDQNGQVTVQVPDNMSDTNYYDHLAPFPVGIGALAVGIPGTSNESFNYNEPCQPINASNPNPIIQCEFNNSYYRNYTATPMWILPNPVNITTMTPNRVDRSFFGTGTPVSFLVNVSLPTADPVSQYFYYLPNGYNGNPSGWSSGLEHITGETVYVDGQYQMNITPETPPQVQVWSQFVNLTSLGWHPGINYLTVYVTTSMGQTFSYTHRFIVGSIQNESLTPTSLYTRIPYMLNWSVNIPSYEISNATFNSSLDITYLGSGCPNVGCPVVNQSIRVNPGKTFYNQSINQTLLESKGFYADSGELPTASDYEVTIWFNANHSGSLRQGISTNFVFDPLAANITGPNPGATVPLGNVTIAYTYQGDYVNTSTLYVYQNATTSGGPATLVYSQLAFAPAQGGIPRSGSATWTAVSSGNFWVELVIGSQNGVKVTRGEAISVQNLNPPTLINKTSTGTGLFGINSAVAATLLVLVSGIVGILLGLWVSPVLRPQSAPGAPSAPAKAWEEGRDDSKGRPTGPKNECSICHEKFETPLGLTQHQRVVHGVEE